jgi:hypothetical protein
MNQKELAKFFSNGRFPGLKSIIAMLIAVFQLSNVDDHCVELVKA